MPLTSSLLFLGLNASPATPPPADWSRLRLVAHVEPLRIRPDGFPLALKADRMLTRAGLTLLHGVAGGEPLDPAALLRF